MQINSKLLSTIITNTLYEIPQFHKVLINCPRLYSEDIRKHTFKGLIDLVKEDYLTQTNVYLSSKIISKEARYIIKVQRIMKMYKDIEFKVINKRPRLEM